MTGALTSEAIVRAWEAGARRSPLDRAMAVLWAAEDGDAADLPLAERDRRLLAVREATFGSHLTSVARCPDCGELVEVTLAAGELARLLVSPGVDEVEVGGRAVSVRPLTSRDLAAAAGALEAEVPGILRARLTGAVELPPEEAGRIDALIEEREAAGELTCGLACVECGTEWSEHLDVAAHVWAEVDAAGRRLLREVAEVAAAFGWSEAAIMAMSETRRAAYLDIARGDA